MKGHRIFGLVSAAAMLAAGSAVLATQAANQGYLEPAERPDLTRILPPPPAPGSPAAQADRDLFVQSRALKDSPRWRQATADVTGDMFDHFACALGVRLTARSAPRLRHLLERAGEDRSVVGDAKTHWQTRRPWIGNDLPICEPRTAHLAGNGDYPSGHAAHGQHVAMILAALAPSRSTQLLARGREFAESRWICGSHSRSAAEAGLLAGAAIFAAEQSSPAFRADMDAARAELAGALATAKGQPAGCPAQYDINERGAPGRAAPGRGG
jgi:hypothetical protein